MSEPVKVEIREAVGVFHTAPEMEAAIEELEEHGFDRAEISLLASEETVREKLGHRFYDAKSLEDDPKVPRTAFVSTESIGDAEGALIGGLMYVGALDRGRAGCGIWWCIRRLTYRSCRWRRIRRSDRRCHGSFCRRSACQIAPAAT
jgi:hypothetical protein